MDGWINASAVNSIVHGHRFDACVDLCGFPLQRLAMECNKAEKHITEADYQSKTHTRAGKVLSEGILGLRRSG